MEWIKVTDRLPAEGEYVLIVTGREVAPSIYRNGEFNRYIKNMSRDDRTYCFRFLKIVYWMPFPEAPEDAINTNTD